MFAKIGQVLYILYIASYMGQMYIVDTTRTASGRPASL